MYLGGTRCNRYWLAMKLVSLLVKRKKRQKPFVLSWLICGPYYRKILLWSLFDSKVHFSAAIRILSIFSCWFTVTGKLKVTVKVTAASVFFVLGSLKSLHSFYGLYFKDFDVCCPSLASWALYTFKQKSNLNYSKPKFRAFFITRTIFAYEDSTAVISPVYR